MPIIGVPNPGDGDDAARIAFADQMSSRIPHVFDDPGSLWTAHEVLSQPTMVFVAADGTTEKRTGSLGPQGLVAKMRELAS